MFDIKAIANATESSSKFLPAGIHKCTFQGVTKDLVASQWEVMSLNLDIEGFGAFTHNFSSLKQIREHKDLNLLMEKILLKRSNL